MASNAIRLGINAKIYRNTGTYSTPVWNEIDNVRDLAMSSNPTVQSAQIRMHGIHDVNVVTKISLTITFQMNWDTADDDWGVINDAFTASATPASNAVDTLAIDRATGAGAEGWRAVCAVTKFDITQNNEGVQVNDVEMRPTVYTSSQATAAWYVGV